MSKGSHGSRQLLLQLLVASRDVFLEGRAGRVGLLTEITAEGTIARVAPFMLFQIRRRREALKTFITAKWLLTCMGSE